MKKLLRMICLTLALCMLAGCGAGGAQPTPSGAFRQTGEAVEPATAQELAACQLAAADYPDYPQRPGMEEPQWLNPTACSGPTVAVPSRSGTRPKWRCAS